MIADEGKIHVEVSPLRDTFAEHMKGSSFIYINMYIMLPRQHNKNVACHQHRCYLGKQGTPISPIHSLITDRTERGNESGTRLSHPYNETTYKWFSRDVASLLEAKTPGSVFSVAKYRQGSPTST